jgi:hypothetical protein
MKGRSFEAWDMAPANSYQYTGRKAKAGNIAVIWEHKIYEERD